MDYTRLYDAQASRSVIRTMRFEPFDGNFDTARIKEVCAKQYAGATLLEPPPRRVDKRMRATRRLATMTEADKERYSRQILFPEIGARGQSGCLPRGPLFSAAVPSGASR